MRSQALAAALAMIGPVPALAASTPVVVGLGNAGDVARDCRESRLLAEEILALSAKRDQLQQQLPGLIAAGDNKGAEQVRQQTAQLQTTITLRDNLRRVMGDRPVDMSKFEWSPDPASIAVIAFGASKSVLWTSSEFGPFTSKFRINAWGQGGGINRTRYQEPHYPSDIDLEVCEVAASLGCDFGLGRMSGEVREREFCESVREGTALVVPLKLRGPSDELALTLILQDRFDTPDVTPSAMRLPEEHFALLRRVVLPVFADWLNSTPSYVMTGSPSKRLFGPGDSGSEKIYRALAPDQKERLRSLLSLPQSDPNALRFLARGSGLVLEMGGASVDQPLFSVTFSAPWSISAARYGNTNLLN